MAIERIVLSNIYRKAAKVIGSVNSGQQIEMAEQYLKLAYQKLYKKIRDKESLDYHFYQLHNELNKKRAIPKPVSF
jgi:hypothetical protein